MEADEEPLTEATETARFGPGEAPGSGASRPPAPPNQRKRGGEEAKDGKGSQSESSAKHSGGDGKPRKPRPFDLGASIWAPRPAWASLRAPAAAGARRPVPLSDFGRSKLAVCVCSFVEKTEKCESLRHDELSSQAISVAPNKLQTTEVGCIEATGGN